MVLNICALLFVLGITFMHSLFGLFSGIINVFCTITALAVAFGCAEPLTRAVTGNVPVPPEYVPAVRTMIRPFPGRGGLCLRKTIFPWVL